MEQERQPFVPYTTEQKKEFAKQFTPKEIQSYRKGQRNAYSHMANTAKRQSFFIDDNLKKDGATAIPSSPPPPQSLKAAASRNGYGNTAPPVSLRPQKSARQPKPSKPK